MDYLEKIVEVSKVIITEGLCKSTTIEPIIVIGLTLNKETNSSDISIETNGLKNRSEQVIYPSMKFTGRSGEAVNHVAKRMLFELKDWHVKNLVKNTSKENKITYLENNNWKPLWTNDYWVVKNIPHTDWSGMPLDTAFYNVKIKELYGK